MKTVLITGANGNLGIAVVRVLSARGYHLYATAGSGEIPEDFHQWTKDTRHVNLTDETDVQEYINNITQDIPDLCAAILLVGGFTPGSFKETDGALIDKQIALNFKTAYFIVRPLMTYFEQHGGGQFILIGARPALSPGTGKSMIAYTLSKSLVIHLAEIINAHGKGKNIHATVIVPSTIDTTQNRTELPDADFTKWVKPEDIAEAIAFVLSDAGSALRETVLKMYHDA